MKLHLHLLREDPTSANPLGHLRVAMFEYWEEGAARSAIPKLTTFGSDLYLDVPNIGKGGTNHPRAGEEARRALAVLLLRGFPHRDDPTPFVLGKPPSRLVAPLLEVLRRVETKSGEGPNSETVLERTKEKWAHAVFDLPPDAALFGGFPGSKGFANTPTLFFGRRANPGSAEADHLSNLVALGTRWQKTTLEVVEHRSLATLHAWVEQWRRPTAAPKRGQGTKNAKPELVPVERWEALADELEGSLEFAVSIEVQRSGRGEWRRVDPGTSCAWLPISAADNFKLRVELPAHAHIYVFWIDPHGDTMPIFPWRPDPARRWQDPTAEERDEPRTSLLITDDFRSALPGEHCGLYADGSAGAQSFVVLVSRRKIPLNALHAWIAETPRLKTPDLMYHHAESLEVLPVVRSPADPTRSAEAPSRPKPSTRLGGVALRAADPLEDLTRILGENLALRADAVRLLVVPSRGGERGRHENRAA